MITVDFSRLETRPGARILDIGCGTGRHTAAAMSLPGVTTVGADACFDDLIAAGERLSIHRQLGATAGGVCCFAQADACRLPFRDGVFDLVICAEVLEHIRDHRAAVREAARVLRPGGEIVVSVPRRWPELICWRLSPSYAHSSGGHIRIYTSRQLTALLQSAALVVRGCHYAHSLHAPYWWLKCLAGIQREQLLPVRLYHRFLTWDMMAKPKPVRFLERLLDPVMGKSLVVYLRKPV